ncbi:hypothetical protein ZHAS_00008385 [Anopheles sinensis]|uniref:Uncharacterized protein n=1 Tax=Anopheles sinensis TaxID=74873 RepID=A0A084VSB6_ANOSI|nr:hypothetical protein ZHAS_00008385 [Anopheles sinensis]
MAERFKVTKADQEGPDEEAAVTGKLLSNEKHQGKRPVGAWGKKEKRNIFY